MITEKLMEELEGESGVFSPRYLNLGYNYLTRSSEDTTSFANFEVRQMDSVHSSACEYFSQYT